MPRTARKAVAAAVAAVVAGLALLGMTAPASASTADAGTLVTLLNDLRGQRGLAPLAVHPELSAIGQRWAEHMAASGQLAHNPGYAGEVTAAWLELGENVGVSAISAGDLHQALVESPAHLRNLVDPDFTHVGVGAVWVDGRLWVSQQFMELAPVAPAAAPAPARAPEVAPAPAAAPAASPPVAAPAPPPEVFEPAADVPADPTAGDRVARVLEPLRALDGAR